MSANLLRRGLYKTVTASSAYSSSAEGLLWMQKATYKNFPMPPNYDHVSIPERQKLRVLEKVPQFPPGVRAPKMTKRLDLIQGEEEVHNYLLHKQYGIVARRGGMLKWGHIEMIRMSVARKLDTSKMFAIWRIDSPWLPRTKLGQGKRMGGGKGSISYYVTPVKAGRIIIEIGGKCSFEEVFPILNMIKGRLPFPAEVVSHESLQKSQEREQQLIDENVNPYTFKYIIQNNIQGCDIWLRNIDRKYFGKFEE